MSLILPSLPYHLQALEPYVSARTLLVHHGRHHAAYVDKARSLVRQTPLEHASLDEIILAADALPDRGMFNAAAQAWNHAFYWRCMRRGGGGKARGALARLIGAQFGTQENLQQELAAAAANHFGSGWAWLVLVNGRLRVTATSNAETPITRRQVPLLAIDVWEHAYYFDYQHRRPDYIAAFLTHLANWEFVGENLQSTAGERLRDAPIREARSTAATMSIGC